MRQIKPLKRIKDRFSLFNDGRKLDSNKRNYIVKAVQQMINNERTQEQLRLGESFGYYGHGPRQRANKLDIGETEIIMIKGKPVVVDNIPAGRTISISCNDEGIVDHEQEFLDTATGRIALSMWESAAGGWSWATGGDDTKRASITKSYHGMDYVKQPNYLSLNHPAMMMEGVNKDDMLLESLKNNGFEQDDAQSIVDAMSEAAIETSSVELEQQIMYLESVQAELQSKLDNTENALSMMIGAAESLPIYISDSQRAAMADLSESRNQATVKAMFESVGNNQAKTLPCGFEAASVGKSPTGDEKTLRENMINFGAPKRRFK